MREDAETSSTAVLLALPCSALTPAVCGIVGRTAYAVTAVPTAMVRVGVKVESGAVGPKISGDP